MILFGVSALKCDSLSDILIPCEQQVIEYINKYDLSAKFCITLDLNDNPDIHLPHRFIDLVSKLHADVEFDTYT